MSCHSTLDTPDWNDDRVELHFSMAGERLTPSKGYFSINPEGIYATYLNVKKEELGIRTKRGTDFWEVAFHLPLKAFGLGGHAGALWRISAGRFHRTSFHGTSALAPVTGHFNREEEAFKFFALGDGGRMPEALLVSPGEMAEYANATGDNMLVFDLPKDSDGASCVLNLNGKSVQCFEQHKNRLCYLYHIQGKQEEKLVFQLRNKNDCVLASGEYSPAVFNPSSRVYPTPAPLFKELFGEKRNSPRLNMTWNMLLNKINYHQALKTGVVYSQDDIYARLKKANVRILLHSAGNLTEQLPQMRKGNYYRPKDNALQDFRQLVSSGKALPCAWYSYYGISGEDVTTHTKGITWRDVGFFGMPLDPINRAAYLALAGNVAENTKGTLGVYFYGDELTTICTSRGLEMNTSFNQANHGEFLKKWNEDVKTKFGGGKYGIPWGLDKKSSAWAPSNLAYFTYMASELAELGRETRDKIKRINPSLIMLSDDAYGNPSAHGVQYWKRYADCGTFQLGEGGGTSGQNFPDYMFTTKLVRDMSGLDELIVCPHEAVDGYPSGAMNSEEIAEAFSQCIRGGATGFHFWPASFLGKSRMKSNAWSNAIGYPSAYEYMLRYAELFNSMPELRFPKTSVAVLVADDTMIATNKFSRLRGVFRLLGLNHQGWFKFVSDTHVRQQWCSLADYAVCYVPAGEVLRPETVQKLEEYVKHGGTIVCADPEFARVNHLFEDYTSARQRLLGVSFETTRTRQVVWNGRNFAITGNACRLLPQHASQGKVLGTYDNGDIAIYEHPLGNGRTICFGFDLFLEENAECKPLSEAVSSLYRELGGSVDNPIWRFKLPMPALPPRSCPEGKCLTGNYGFWDRHRFLAGRLQNCTEDGRITIKKSDGGISTAIFGESRLTDRLSYFKHSERFDQLDGEKFTESFPPGKHEVIFEFSGKTIVNEVVCYYAQGGAKLRFEVQRDGKWESVAEMRMPSTTALEVRRESLKVHAEGQCFRMIIDVPEGGTPCILAEVEVWGGKR